MILQNKNSLSFKSLNYKIILFSTFILYIVFILFISFVFDVDYYQVWKFLGVPAREILFSGGYSGKLPPDPISNSVVKLPSADGTTS